jgi:hypothetical protein
MVVRFVKKSIIVIIATLISCVIFSLVFYYIKGYTLISQLDIIKSNLFSRTKFETDYFTINLPKFDWRCIYDGGTQTLAFAGLSLLEDDIEIRPVVTMMRFTSLSPDDPLSKKFWFENDMSDIEKICKEANATLTKTTHLIDGKEFTAYDCNEEEFPLKYIIYKDVFFQLIAYNNTNFKPQYDKFFEGVKLKK